MTVRDLWSGKELPPIVNGVMTVGPLAPHDSVLAMVSLK